MKDILIYMMKRTYTHIELLDRFMKGETSLEEEQTLLAWFGALIIKKRSWPFINYVGRIL